MFVLFLNLHIIVLIGRCGVVTSLLFDFFGRIFHCVLGLA
jgi:hypothetical protein